MSGIEMRRMDKAGTLALLDRIRAAIEASGDGSEVTLHVSGIGGEFQVYAFWSEERGSYVHIGAHTVSPPGSEGTELAGDP